MLKTTVQDRQHAVNSEAKRSPAGETFNRAKLLELTPTGRSTLARIQAAQRQWSDALGARIGEGVLRQAHTSLEPLVEAVERGKRP
jgi:DNA-binding MarR family transcriptional regulator